MDTPMVQGSPAEESAEGRWLVEATSQVMQVSSWRWVRDGLSQLVGRPTPGGDDALEIRGRLLVEADRAYDRLVEPFRRRGYVLLLRKEGDDQLVLAIPGRLPETAGRPWVAAGMFLLTLLSVLWTGAQYSQLPGEPFELLAGWPFAASLLGILLAHEMGHYVVARWQHVPASPPYFIPFPTLLGTMGAVIQTKAPPRNRRALLLLGAAGPLAGMVVAVPVLLLGLMLSPVSQIPPGAGYFQEGNSLLYAWMKFLVFGQFLPSGGLDVMIHPIALAGWAGLLVTGMNLIPAGQLDGGHITYALLGRRARWLNWGVIGVLLALSFLWQGWLLWAGLVFFLGRVHSVPLDDVTPLGSREKLIAAISFAVFLLVFIPIPISFG